MKGSQRSQLRSKQPGQMAGEMMRGEQSAVVAARVGCMERCVYWYEGVERDCRKETTEI